MTDIIYPVVVLGGLGSAFGIILAIASKVFFVPTDPKVEQLQNVLPGANCGACGFPGCAGLAQALADGKAPVNACSVGGQKVADLVAGILGTEAEAVEKQVAVVLCQGDCDKAKDKFIYEGIQDCRIASRLSDGQKACSFGCTGCGTCYNVCQFDAIEMVNGIAVIDREKCTACKKCIEVCPKKIIELVPYDNHAIVKCKSEDPGKVVRGNCSIGCIGCQICVKNCPSNAFAFENNLAKINYDKCTNCMICVEKCPTKAIVNPVKEESLAN
jgi:Na+-translocating ferredoxin:NAD+ oxidoreductase RNF subunit RnfB